MSPVTRKRAAKKARPAPRPPKKRSRPAAPPAEQVALAPPVRMALPEKALFTTSNLFYHAIQTAHGAGEIRPVRFGLGRWMVVARGQHKIGLVRGGCGAPAATIVLEEAIASGARELIFFGPAASVAPRVVTGDIVLPSEAVSAEGTSAYYLPPRQPRTPDTGLRNEIARLLDGAGIPYHSGRVVTTDAPYRQNDPRIEAYRKGRFLALETELAALLAVCRFRRVRAVGLLIVAGSLSDPILDPGADRPAFLNAIARSATALAALDFEPATATP